jgi:hypothetical protein
VLWIAYYHNGREIRESTHTDAESIAQAILGNRIEAVTRERRSRARALASARMGRTLRGPWKTYLIQSTEGGLIKIGKVREGHHAKRLQTLQCGSPTRLVLLGLTDDPEARLHRMFATLRVHGEWFRPEKELITYIERLREGVAA